MSLRARGAAWAVSTPHVLATDAAAQAFGRGGNAVDAALSAAVVLAVAYPHMCGVGGDLFALVRRPDETVTTLISAGAAPAGVEPAAVRRRSGAGGRAAGADAITVPGASAGWDVLHRNGARLPRASAFDRAIELARSGVAVSSSLAASLREMRATTDSGLRAIFFDGEAPLERGDHFRQPALAETLRRLAAHGSRDLYAGTTGRALADGLGRAGSPLSASDLAAHRVEEVPPLRASALGAEVLTAPPPSQGYVLPQILAVAGRLGLDPDPLGADAGNLARIFAATAVERDASLADPARGTVAVDPMADDTLARLAAGSVGAGEHRGDTIALTTADAEGWAVSLIQSLYDGFGSGILEPETGIIAHSRGACFSLEPGHPNELAPSVRPAHTLMPVMVVRDAALLAVAGSMGGEAQPQINAENLWRVLGLGWDPADALSAPRWVVDGGHADVDADVPPAVAERIRAAGFDVRVLEPTDHATGHASFITCGNGFVAAADPRADGSAAAG